MYTERLIQNHLGKIKVNDSCWGMCWTESDRCFLFKDHGLKRKGKSQVEGGYNRVLQRLVLGWILFIIFVNNHDA